MDEGADGVEVHVGRYRRLVKRTNSARLGLALGRMHLINELVEQTQTGYGVASTNERLPLVIGSLTVVA